jgi:predicted nucleic-acid-binding Zn-ribbon protein
MGIFSGPEATCVEINGVVLKCNHCKNDEFFKDKRLLNSAGATFLGLDWANKEALLYICSKCGNIHWFLMGK